MDPIQQNIVFGAACGLNNIRYFDGFWVYGAQDICLRLPNYYNDLNAMHEAEKRLGLNKDSEYWSHVIDVVHESGFKHHTCCASAPQRLKAALKRLGLWQN
jgi:hypothetical protein